LRIRWTQVFDVQQDSSNVAVAKVSTKALDRLRQVTCRRTVPSSSAPNSPIGNYDRGCGTFYTPSTSYPAASRSQGWQECLRLLNQNNTLTKTT